MSSPPLIVDKEKEIDSFLTDFLQSSLLAQTEADFWVTYFWVTFLPYVKLVYLPNCRPDNIFLVALEIIIMTLHIMLDYQDREVNRGILIREGLMDYITCMPWYTTGAAEQRARALVRMVQQAPDVDLQPPSLVNMTKACVAKNYCGQQTIVHLSVPEILRNLIKDTCT